MKAENLSNKELVEEFGEVWIDIIKADYIDIEIIERKNTLKEEILRRLQEPWRRQKQE